MNQHLTARRRAKAERRARRTSGPTRGNIRGPITRAMGRVNLERQGAARIHGMGVKIALELEARGVRVYA